MTLSQHIDLGMPALLEFRGPDAVRFLNGQMTQDVRKVIGTDIALPSCITDAKGKLQFRVWIHARGEALMIEGPEDSSEALEVRLTRYLIADDVDVTNLSGKWRLHHLTGINGALPDEMMTRSSQRYHLQGIDCWVSAGETPEALDDLPVLDGDALESFRIAQGVPLWSNELADGLLPPEAGLDATDISYHKGCYIGQEVISRIKSAGKVNKHLTRFRFAADLPTDGLRLIDADGKPAGELTSIAPQADQDTRWALGFLKRGTEGVRLLTQDGVTHLVNLVGNESF